MIRYIFFYILLCSCQGISGKDIKTSTIHLYFLVDKEADDSASYTILVNNKQIPFSARDSFPFDVHYPLSDTIELSRFKGRHILITALKPDVDYALVITEEDLQIYPLMNMEGDGVNPEVLGLISDYSLYGFNYTEDVYTEYEDDFLSQNQNEYTGSIIIKLLNNNLDTTIGFIYAHLDFDEGKGIVVAQNKIKIPREDLYETLSFAFGSGAIQNENMIYDDRQFQNFYLDDSHFFVFHENPTYTNYTFSNKETLEITYDCKTKKTSLKIK